MMQLSQISRRVEDLARARAFYARLGIAELYAFPGLAFLALGPTRLMLRETGRREEADILYLSTPDLETRVDALKAAGIVFTRGAQMIHRHPDGIEEWMAFFQDDEGRDLALHALRDARRAP